MGRYHFEGLTEVEVFSSRRTHGSNALPSPQVETFWEKLLDNFKDPLIKILGVALGITLLLAVFGYASWIEGIGIAAAVFLATFVATYSEHKNEESFQELQREASKRHANVFRFEQIRLPFLLFCHFLPYFAFFINYTTIDRCNS